MSQEMNKGTEKTLAKSGSRLAAVLIRSFMNISPDIRETLFLLRLRNKHVCVVLEDNETNRGMLKKAKDYITWGEIDDATVKNLISKRGVPDPNNKGKTKKFFALHPPIGGFEKKGIKVPYAKGGALGYRSNMNELLVKMI